MQRLEGVEPFAGRVQVRVEGEGRDGWVRWVEDCVEERGWELGGEASTGEFRVQSLRSD